METVAIVSDTHLYHDVPEAIPAWVDARIRGADHVIHAGDFVTGTVLQHFEENATALTAVRGNADVAGVDLPTATTITIEGVTFGVTHPMGIEDASMNPSAYESAVLSPIRELTDDDFIAVAGHTHKIIDTVVDGTRLLNPGTATAALPATEETMMVARVSAGEISIEVLGPDGPLDFDRSEY